MGRGRLLGVTEENVIIRADGCAVTLLPDLGGKIASITVHGKELLQSPLRPPAARTRSMGFDESDASGWDECLPSVAACSVTTEAGEVTIPDHGDLWRVMWEKQGSEGRQGSGDRAVALRGRCFSLPLELERSLELTVTDRGWRLDLGYKLVNVGAVRVPWSWAAHPLFLAEAGDRIVLPASTRSLRLEGSGGGRLGKKGDAVSWPVANLAAREGADGEASDRRSTDLSTALGADAGIGDKLFAGPLGVNGSPDGWCSLERPGAGVRIRVDFDPKATPYLGLWVCYGGWPDRPGPKQTCVAMEPATAPVDSLAETGTWSRELGPGEEFAWRMAVDIELLK